MCSCRIELDGTFWNSSSGDTKLQCTYVARNPGLGVSAAPAEVQTLENLGTSRHKPGNERWQEMLHHMGGSLHGWVIGSVAYWLCSLGE